VPRFAVTSEMSLVDGLKNMGIEDVFDFEKSDFSPLTESSDNVAVTDVSHAARVKIDEEGCTAVAYTVIYACGACMPPAQNVDFVLDRPFIFAIMGQDDIPLFIGIVNNPV